MTAISMKNIGFAHDPHQAPVISHLDLDIPRGSVAAILGANGVGKTTLLYLLLGLHTPDKGELFFFEKPRSHYKTHQIKQLIGMVSQNESIPFDLSVAEYVLLGRAPHLNLLRLPASQEREAAGNALEIVRMAHMADWGMTRLSSGEKQLVTVARALCQDPDILLLDEPCSHLDLINSRQMLYLMKTIAQKGRTIVFTTHDPNAAAAIADQVILLKKGELVAAGSPQLTLTPELLTKTYGGPIDVMTTARGPLVMAI